MHYLDFLTIRIYVFLFYPFLKAVPFNYKATTVPWTQDLQWETEQKNFQQCKQKKKKEEFSSLVKIQTVLFICACFY